MENSLERLRLQEVSQIILSVPEGDDKPLKYPLMFSKCDLVLINKIDALSYFNFSIDKAKERILYLNPKAKIIPISEKTKEGMDEVVAWLKDQMNDFLEKNSKNLKKFSNLSEEEKIMYKHDLVHAFIL